MITSSVCCLKKLSLMMMMMILWEMMLFALRLFDKMFQHYITFLSRSARWQPYIFIFHCCQDVTSSSMWPPAQIGEEIIQINKLKRVNVYAWVNLFCSKLFWLCSQQNIYRTNCCWQDASLCSRTSCYLYQNHTMR